MPLQAGNVQQPQRGIGREPGLDLLWEGGGVTSHVYCGGRMTRNGLVILVSRNALGLKRQDDVRLAAPDRLDQPLYDLQRWRLHKGIGMILRWRIPPARITIAQHDGFLQAQYLTRALQFLVPHLSQGLAGCDTWLANIAFLTIRGTHQMSLYPTSSAGCQHPGGREGFIIGVRKAGQHAYLRHAVSPPVWQSLCIYEL